MSGLMRLVNRVSGRVVALFDNDGYEAGESIFFSSEGYVSVEATRGTKENEVVFTVQNGRSEKSLKVVSGNAFIRELQVKKPGLAETLERLVDEASIQTEGQVVAADFLDKLISRTEATVEGLKRRRKEIRNTETRVDIDFVLKRSLWEVYGLWTSEAYREIESDLRDRGNKSTLDKHLEGGK